MHHYKPIGRSLKPLLPSFMLFLVAIGAVFSMMTDLVLASADLTDAQMAKLEKGDVLVAVRHTVRPSKGTVEATILIDAFAESIWQVMVNCHEIPTFVPGLKDCQVLASGENWEIIRHDVKWIWFFPKLTYVFRAHYEQNRRIDFTRLEGDLREMKGSWRLTPMGDGHQTLLRYSVFLDPGFFVPQWLVRFSLKKSLPDVLTAIRTKVLNNRGRQQP